MSLVLVTGASSGIGAACARLAARDGHDLVLTYNSNPAGANSVADELRAMGRDAQVMAMNSEDPASIAALFQGLDAAGLRLNAVVNNAGMTAPPARVEAMTPERISQMMAVNLVAPMMVAGQAVRRMSRANGGAGGVIVNISSVAARLGSAGMFVDYAASKAGLDIFTKGLANEVAAEGIRVCGVRPGLIETPIHAKGQVPDRAQSLAHSVPMQRIGAPEEVAEMVVWLISDKASYVTGATFDVSGGR